MSDTLDSPPSKKEQKEQTEPNNPQPGQSAKGVGEEQPEENSGKSKQETAQPRTHLWRGAQTIAKQLNAIDFAGTFTPEFFEKHKVRNYKSHQVSPSGEDEGQQTCVVRLAEKTKSGEKERTMTFTQQNARMSVKVAESDVSIAAKLLFQAYRKASSHEEASVPKLTFVLRSFEPKRLWKDFVKALMIDGRFHRVKFKSPGRDALITYKLNEEGEVVEDKPTPSESEEAAQKDLSGENDAKATITPSSS